MELRDPTSGDMHPATFWRQGASVAVSANIADEMYLEQAGYTQVAPAQTRPAARYYLPGNYETPVDPRRWERVTGLPASRRAEYCPICGQHRAACPGHPKQSRQAYTTTWRADGKSRARYFAWDDDDAVGSAHTLEHEVAYRKAGWKQIARLEACRLAQAPGRWVDGVWVRPRCTLGGPDRILPLSEWLAVAKHRNKKWYEIKMT